MGAFNFANSNGFVATGTVGSGALAASGAGIRLMWYPRKATFRAGEVLNDAWNDINIGHASVAMGSDVRASGAYSVATGSNTRANGSNSTAMGSNTTASSAGSTAMGNWTIASGTYSVAMGSDTIASGTNSTAMGYRASTNGMEGAFVYGDRSNPIANVSATAPNEFVVRAAGGLRFRTNPGLTTGCNLPAGSGVFTCSSSRLTKDDVHGEDGNEVLSRLRSIPVHSWSYTSEPGVRHIGPFAEDFHAAFGLGVDDTSIGLLDIAGVTLAAVQAIDGNHERLQADIARLVEKNTALKSELAALRQMLEELARHRR